MVSNKSPTVSDARKIGHPISKLTPSENYVTCRFPYQYMCIIYKCIIYKEISQFQRGVYERDDCVSSYLQSKYVKQQCNEFDFNMTVETFTAII